MPSVHVIIPCYNEEKTLHACVERVLNATLPRGWDLDVTIVDDCSGDETRRIAKLVHESDERIHLVTHARNRGKGAAVRSGFDLVLEKACEDDLCVVQDADLEYDPNDLAPMIQLLQEENVDAVYGDRFERGQRPSPLGHLHTLINRMLTVFSNAMTGLSIADMECCYKLIRIPALKRIAPELDEDRFGIEPQITAALSRAGARMLDLPISYAPRRFDDGKKIGARDGMRAVLVIFKERFKGGQS